MPPKKAATVQEEKPEPKTNEVKKVADEKKPSGGDSNLFAAVSYILGILAIVIYLIKKDDKFAKFHSLQALAFGIAMFVVVVGLNVLVMILAVVSGGVGGVLGFCTFPLVLVFVIYDLFVAYQAYQGIMYKIPVIGDMVEKYV